MKGIPQEKYTKDLREEAAKMVTEGRISDRSATLCTSRRRYKTFSSHQPCRL